MPFYRTAHLDCFQLNKQLIEMASLIRPSMKQKNQKPKNTTNNGRSSLLTSNYIAPNAHSTSTFDLGSSSIADLDESIVAAANTILSISASSNSSTTKNRKRSTVYFAS